MEGPAFAELLPPMTEAVPEGGAAITLDLTQWLQRLRSTSWPARPAALLVGATGHLILSAAETDEAQAQLRTRVLPDIRIQATAGSVQLVTGSAPGADLIFTRTARDWLRRVGLSCEVVAVEAVPVDWMVEDWLQRLEADGQPPAAGAREAGDAELRRAFAEADVRLRLFDPNELRFASSQAWREQQYRKLASLLAERVDILVAVLRASSQREPGGTAEVVEWRRRPERIPLQVSTLGVDEMPSSGARRPLIIVDPTVAWTPPSAQPDAEVSNAERSSERQAYVEADTARRAGNDLLCNDILYRALKQGVRSPRLDYLRIQSLANAGSTGLALEQYRGLDLKPDELDEDWLALQGRLEKDLALAGGAGARQHFAQAAGAYLDAFRRFGGFYSAINAASMSFLAGDRTQARALALETLEKLESSEPRDDLDRFFRLATEAEASLLLDRPQRCAECLSAADAYIPDDVLRRSRTLLQLRELCLHRGLPPSMLAVLKMPPVVALQLAWSAPHSEAILNPDTSALARIPSGALVYHSLSGPQDLQLAELLLERGARLYLSVAESHRELSKHWERDWGSALADRLRSVLMRAERTALVPGFRDTEYQWCAHHLCATSFGLSLMTAQRRVASWRQYRVSDASGDVALDPVDEVDFLVERRAGRATVEQVLANSASVQRPEDRRMVGILFADFAGFRRIGDDDLPRFWRDVIGAMALILDHYTDSVLLRSTWGDALHVITSDAATAARIAVEIQHDLELRRSLPSGRLAELELRLAVHYAPAYEGFDPVRRHPLYYGSQLSFAARIEPVAPPGMIYGSESFAARLAVEAPGEYSAEYAGEVELAKRFGRYRLYAVRPSSPPGQERGLLPG